MPAAPPEEAKLSIAAANQSKSALSVGAPAFMPKPKEEKMPIPKPYNIKPCIQPYSQQIKVSYISSWVKKAKASENLEWNISPEYSIEERKAPPVVSPVAYPQYMPQDQSQYYQSMQYFAYPPEYFMQPYPGTYPDPYSYMSPGIPTETTAPPARPIINKSTGVKEGKI